MAQARTSATALPYTFYDRYTPAARRTIDRRQPLPSTFAARYIQGGVGAFATNITIWREGFNGAEASCASSVNNATMAYGEIVRFDEHENPFTLSCFGYFGCYGYPTLPATSSTNTASATYPTLGGPDVGGWLYINASNCGSTLYSVTTDVGGVPGPTNRPGNLSPAGGTTLYGPRPSQNWVTVTMFGNVGTNRMTAEFDAASLGNGCSPGAFLTAMRPDRPRRRRLRLSARHDAHERHDHPVHRHERQPDPMKTLRILLASLFLCGNVSAAMPSSINNDDSCDIKVGPAATLLLPYFEVDFLGTSGQTTLFTVTNVTRYPQIAHVTLWTDWAYPVMTFNLFLTGYDVQGINLADILVRGIIAPPSGTTSATTPGALSAAGTGNLRTPLDCASNPGTVPASIIAAVRRALTTGVVNPGGGVTGCSTAGGVHANAIGYATIDVVANCTNLMPSDPTYYTTDLLFDNVLIGDYQQIGAQPGRHGVRRRQRVRRGGQPDGAHPRRARGRRRGG